MKSRVSNPLVVGVLILGAIGCSNDIEGPTPGVPAPSAGEPLPVDPGIICRAQQETLVTLNGAGLSPLVIDALEETARVDLPTVTLSRTATLDGSGTDAETVVYSGNPDDPVNRDLLRWHDQERMTFTVNQSLALPDGSEGMLAVGMHDVRLTNGNTNETTTAGVLAVVDKPELTNLLPPITCLAEGARTITLEGESFVSIAGESATVTVEGVEEPLTVTYPDESCTGVAHDGIDAEVCTRAELVLETDSVDVGFPGLGLQNPETAACSSEEEINLRVVPPPTIDTIEPPIACTEQEDREFVISGSDFLTIDGAVPTVTVGGAEFEAAAEDCAELETMNLQVASCNALRVTVPAASVETGRLPVVVTNPEPAGCSNQAEAAVTIVPPPTVTAVEPPLICVDDGPRDITVVGSGFLVIDGDLPTVSFDDSAIDAMAVVPGDCSELEVDRLGVETCNELTVTVTDMDLSLGTPSVTVTNPAPAGCTTTAEELFEVVPGPVITGAEPPLVCTDDGERQLVIEGTGFLDVDGTTPTVAIDGVDVTVDSLDGCTDASGAGGITAQTCTQIGVTVPQGTLMEGTAEIVVTNPQPAGCTATDSTVLTVPPPVTIASFEPNNVCVGGAGGVVSVTVSGTGFLVVDGTEFSVTVDGAPTTPQNARDCTDLMVDGLAVESCQTFDIDVDTTGASIGDIPVTVTNPDPSGCGVTSTDFGIVDTPTIDGVQPVNICSDVQETITITGTNFSSGATVTATQGGTTITADTVTFVSSTEVEATFMAGLGTGTWDITLSNGTACSDTAQTVLTVDPTPLVFFVDPPVVYNGISTEVLILTSGLASDATGVEIVDSGGNTTPLTFASTTRPNRIQATIPSGLAAGDYEVRVTSPDGCVGGLSSGVTVTDQTNVAITGIDPAFGWQQEPTGVSVTADPNAAAADQFQNGARVYLNPTGGGAGTATELRATAFISSTEITGIVPANLTVGDYDVIVVNPDGGVGLLTAGYSVTLEPPPVIASVEPGSWEKDTTTDVTVVGEDFRYDDTVVMDPLTVDCVADDGTSTQIGVTLDTASSTDTQVIATVDTTGAGEFSICTLTFTNPDGTFGSFSPAIVTNPTVATNFFQFQPGGTLDTGRRAPAVVGGQASQKQRYVYVVGGDDGNPDNAFDTVEFSRIDRFGEPLDWNVMPRHSLPAGGRTLSKAVRVDDFVYLVAGYNGTGSANPGATGEVLRANVLDPLFVPEIVDADFEVMQGSGLSEGIWYYRVSAVLDSTSDYNPDGETLTSEPLPINVPTSVDGALIPTIRWNSFPEAVEYRVYRSPSANVVFGEEELIGTVSDTGAATYTLRDDATSPVMPIEKAIPVGSLGTWHAATTLGDIGARFSHGLTMVQDPNTPSDFHVYAAGGEDGTGLLDSIDFFTVQVSGPRDQTVTAVTTGAATLSSARTELDVSVADAKTARILTSPPLLYALGGKTSTTGPVTYDQVTEYFPISPGGGLGALVTVTDYALDYAGYIGGIFNSQVILMTGFKAGPSNRAQYVNLNADGSVGVWDDFDPRDLTQRYLAGASPFLGFYYVAGGSDDLQTASDVVDFAAVGAASP